MASETFWNVALKRFENSASHENYIRRGILCKFWVHFCLLRHSVIWLKKWLKFLVGLKTTSSDGCYVTFKSIFPFWEILEHELKKGLTILLAMKTTSSMGYYLTFYSILSFWGILEHDLERSWNFSLLWNLHQKGNIR